MKTLVMVVILVSVLAVPVFAYDWATSPVNGHRYILVDSSSWTGAEAQAVVLGGHLATIRNDAENDWIYQFALANKESCYRLWMGLHIMEGASGPAPGYGWEWVSGESISYTRWNYIDGMDPADPIWSNHNRGGFMWVRYWDPPWKNYEQMTSWGPELEEGLPWHGSYSTGIVEVVPEPSSIFALIGGLATLTTLKRRRKG